VKYREPPEPGLLSFITPVWNTPPEYLEALADSILGQIGDPPFEWVVLDNGSTDARTRDVIERRLALHPKVALLRSDENLGIVGGSRFCLEHASGRYVLLVDHDDRLYPDCASTVAHWLRRCDYPAAMFTDEDKLVGGEAALPFLKPAWDPVLFANQCYTAHLGVVDRGLALELGAFSDRNAEGSPDWDCLMRFHIAGYDPVHLPEVLYSWRMHPASTAQNMDSKSYIHSSQRAVVERYRRSLPQPEHFDVELSPLFPGTPDWRMRRSRAAPRPALLLRLGQAASSVSPAEGDYPFSATSVVHGTSPPSRALEAVPAWLPDEALVAVLDDRVRVIEPEWVWEALGIIERYPDTGVVGGRLFGGDDRIVSAGQVLGFETACGCPDEGRGIDDPGYSVWLLKQRSVDAVAAAMCVVTAGFLRHVVQYGCPPEASWSGFGAWVGAHAARTGVRVVYSPFVSGRVKADAVVGMGDHERSRFRGILPCDRWYARGFGLSLATNYRPVEAAERRLQIDAIAGVTGDAGPGLAP
jgi:hypothetical protein